MAVMVSHRTETNLWHSVASVQVHDRDLHDVGQLVLVQHDRLGSSPLRPVSQGIVEVELFFDQLVLQQ